MSETNSNEASPDKTKNNNTDLFGKIGMVMRLKSQKVKGKLFDYIVNPSASVNSNMDIKGNKDLEYIRRSRKTAPVFSIDDDQELGKLMLKLFVYIYIHTHIRIKNTQIFLRYDNDQ